MANPFRVKSVKTEQEIMPRDRRISIFPFPKHRNTHLQKRFCSSFSLLLWKRKHDMSSLMFSSYI
jgi:hypothetical protein